MDVFKCAKGQLATDDIGGVQDRKLQADTSLGYSK